MVRHFLQSDEWRHFQAALGRTVVSDNGDGWSYHAYLESGKGNSRLYTPYGPVARDEASLQAALSSLVQAAKKQGVTFVRIEPTTGTTPDMLKRDGWKQVTYQQLNPARTQVIDLTSSPDDILAGMSQNSRNITRNYHKKGISISYSNDPTHIHLFTDLMQMVATRNQITAHSRSYFQAQADALFPLGAACLYTATVDSAVVAAAIVFDSPTTRYYAHAAADDTYRKLSPGTALVGQMILDAKDKGQTSFDLYGIAPDDSPTHPWHGFTRFKQSFGGTPIDYFGSWDLPLKPVAYTTYRAYQSLRRRARR